MSEPIREAGPWQVYAVAACRIGVASEDFTHDAILWVNGNFKDEGQKLAYAEEIARRLNAWQEKKP
jgi:hypothetical protein